MTASLTAHRENICHGKKLLPGSTHCQEVFLESMRLLLNSKWNQVRCCKTSYVLRGIRAFWYFAKYCESYVLANFDFCCVISISQEIEISCCSSNLCNSASGRSSSPPPPCHPPPPWGLLATVLLSLLLKTWFVTFPFFRVNILTLFLSDPGPIIVYPCQ